VANDDETRDEAHEGTAAGETTGAAVGVVGATTTLTRSLSEADLALFALVMGEANLATDARLEAEPSYQRVAPPALLAALLTTSAAQHSERPPLARFISGQVRFIEPAYADETVRASATVTGIDGATGALHINARCETEDGRSLAEADFLVQRD
jgi:acyl dehydratase